ncbi:hypothetical protein AGABI2DRAFT_188106 [Agaricus bisporus var. bisporus H97]|uniref:hypothetical protein n=1 Tax=Agaricus bisporus var. bisporus (strain H97 / ATCC MYA-4626 / FGSC 10389) TaxID=936046 RepID=UPI00029F5DB0|nr:hypothetical protein AGABI2DRAFT_188106 [Agaricus bisporus var. bisporus H97]EKV43035.1 hypothetical protein AGABI2DRAFT_188106 [Agaricus bisporus var. bisporus H97]
MALTALLNSLHTHLQTQTQLLPTLHAQLGLPPNTLEEDLIVLQEQLIKGVEGQIEARRKEVEEWMSKCDVVENECIRYAKALGPNFKSTGESVGELRKESILPRRYELGTELQEKSRQLYHSKLEQLMTITNRLHTLARTLGNTFFSPDVLEPTVANGENVLDPESYRDVSPDRFLTLEKELVRGKGELLRRLSQLANTFVQIDWLYSELGLLTPTVDDICSNSRPIASTSSSPVTTSPNSDPFLLTPTPFSRSSSNRNIHSESLELEYQKIFARFAVRIEEADDEALSSNQGVPYGLENVDPSQGLISWAKGLQASLEDLKRKREAHIQTMYDQLESLWRRLGVDEDSMDAFVEKHRGSTEETVRQYEEELERMINLKRERMSTFVESAREELVKLWDYLMVGDDERADFAPFIDDDNTEELLTIHEDEIKRLKEERRLKAPLLANIRKYFDICEEEKELALAASDQTRLLGRGPRDPGRLLREEKMRKRVSKEKPRLERDLLTSIPAWEQEAGRPFLVHGQSILQMLMENVNAAGQENKRKPTRAGSVPPRATTPVNSSSHSSSGSRMGAVTPAVRPRSAMSSLSVPSKRRKLNDSSSSSTNGHTAGRAPLSNHRNNDNMQARPASLSRSRTKTPGSVMSSALKANHAIPRPVTRYQTLGHGRPPNTQTHSSGMRSVSADARGSSSVIYGRPKTSSKSMPGPESCVLRKASRAKRESFKPRPSMDGAELGKSAGIGNGSRWGGGNVATSVEEEDEGY